MIYIYTYIYIYMIYIYIYIYKQLLDDTVYISILVIYIQMLFSYIYTFYTYLLAVFIDIFDKNLCIYRFYIHSFIRRFKIGRFSADEEWVYVWSYLGRTMNLFYIFLYSFIDIYQ